MSAFIAENGPPVAQREPEPPTSSTPKADHGCASEIKAVDAWKLFQQFEGFSYKDIDEGVVDGKSCIRVCNEDRGETVSADKSSVAERFLAEFDRLASAAIAAGCTYSDSVLAFKLLEKYPIQDSVEMENFLASVPDRLLHNISHPSLSTVRSAEQTQVENNIDHVEESLLTLVKTFVKFNHLMTNASVKNFSLLHEDCQDQEDKTVLSDDFRTSQLDTDWDDDGMARLMLTMCEDVSSKSKTRGSGADGKAIQANHSNDQDTTTQDVEALFEIKQEDMDIDSFDQGNISHGDTNASVTEINVKAFPKKKSDMKYRKRRKSRPKNKLDDKSAIKESNEDGGQTLPFQCHYCQKILSSKDKMLKHIKQIHEGIKVTCDECGKTLSSEDTLRLHKLTLHQGIRFPCDECGKQFRRKFHVARHKKLAHSDVPHDITELCDKCGFQASSKEALGSHKKRVHGREYHACVDCKFVGRTAFELAAHVTVLHKGEELACENCDFTTSLLADFNRHRAVVHKEGHATVFSCDQCDFICFRKQRLQTHKENKHLGVKYSCSLCSASLASKMSLKNHITLMHGSDLHVCDECGHEARNKYQLQFHRRRVHEKRYKAPCNQCDHVSPNHTELRVHVLTKHEGVMFPCDECEFKSAHPKYLKRHKDIYHGNKRFHCDQCDYTAKDNGLVTKHKQTKHQGVEFPCDICDMKFATQPSLKKHKKAKHSLTNGNYLAFQLPKQPAEIK